MKNNSLLAAIVMSASFVAAGSALAQAPQPNAERPAASAGSEWLGAQDIVQRLEAAGYRNFEEVERKSTGYRVKATDSNEQHVKLHVDPLTGKVMNDQWLDAQAILSRLAEAGYSNFTEVERESDGYEVKATDAQGRHVELDVHPITGEVVKIEVKHGKQR